MDLSFNPEEIAFRDEVRAFFKAALPADIQRRMYRGQYIPKTDLVAWHRILTEKGWVAPEWTPEWGGTGWTAAQLYIFAEEMHRAYAPQQRSQNINLAGNTLVAFGSYNYLGDLAANSPIVTGPGGSRNQFIVGSALSWRFSW